MISFKENELMNYRIYSKNTIKFLLMDGLLEIDYYSLKNIEKSYFRVSRNITLIVL